MLTKIGAPATAFGMPAFVALALTWMPGPHITPPSIQELVRPFTAPQILTIPVAVRELKPFWPLPPLHFLALHQDMPEDHFNPLYADLVYSETPPQIKPADVVQEQLKNIPLGSPAEEIERISDAFGMENRYMLAVAKIESDFEPNNRTGKYLGLYQLSNHEFERYGPTKGSIYNPRDNAIAAAAKMQTEEGMFKLGTRHIPSTATMYLIHQQGIQGAAEHIQDAHRIAWKSMCATDEGREKGASWCKKAIWGNTLPQVKAIWKTVEAFTSGAFVQMWNGRVTGLLAGAHAPSAWHYAAIRTRVKTHKKTRIARRAGHKKLAAK